VSLAGVGFLVSLTKERMMRYTIAVPSLSIENAHFLPPNIV
jgi:hypothetical protein